MVGGAVFCEQLRLAIAGVMGMRQAEVDEKRALVLFLFPFAELIEHAVGVPSTAGFVGAAALGGVVDDAELLVRCGIAVALFAGAHGGVSGAVEDGADGVFLKVGRAFLRTGADRQVLEGATAHDHVS